METEALVESLEIWDLTAAYQLCVTFICHLVLGGLSSFTSKMGGLGEIIYSQTMLIIGITTDVFLKRAPSQTYSQFQWREEKGEKEQMPRIHNGNKLPRLFWRTVEEQLVLRVAQLQGCYLLVRTPRAPFPRTGMCLGPLRVARHSSPVGADYRRWSFPSMGILWFYGIREEWGVEWTVAQKHIVNHGGTVAMTIG